MDVTVFPFRPLVSKVQKLMEKSARWSGRSAVAQGHVGGERISAYCISARMRGEVALESTAGGRPLQCEHLVGAQPGYTVIIEESVKLKVTRRHRESRANWLTKSPGNIIARAEANCPVGAEVSNWKLDGCTDADGRLAREAMS